MSGASTTWFAVANADEIPSPALLVYPDRIEANVRRMLALAGGPERLRPHVKTHKLLEVVRLQQRLGIDKFKCATIAEAEMVAGCGASDVLLAYQPVGPNIRRLLALGAKFPGTRFAAIMDDLAAARARSAAAVAAGRDLELLVDLDCGMHRTGLPAGPAAEALYQALGQLPRLRPGGLHAYDGHIHDSDAGLRATAVAAAFAPVRTLRARLVAAGHRVPRLVVGGTPTFPIHARAPDVECSPGTCLLWDASYGETLPDLAFEPAAAVLTRVVSRPGPGRLCLDLGHKAIAAENPAPRVRLPQLPDAVAVMHNEEHLVIETAHAAEFSVGDVLYGIPWHICPTVALHATACAVRAGRADATWRVTARDRQLTL